MSNFPGGFDDDVTLPFVNNNLTEIGGEAINALRDAVVAMQENIGLNAQGTTFSLSDRLGISFNPDGTLKPSAFTSLSLASVDFVDITNSQISNMAEIAESKLRLDHRTQDLFNYIRNLSKDINLAIGWISITGVKLDPHLIGTIYRHTLSHIDVTGDTVGSPYLTNKFNLLRNNTNSYTLINDMNNELRAHQFADGSAAVTPTLITTNDGSTYPATHAHVSSGIFLNTSRFSSIPQTATDVQQFAEFVDSTSLLLLGGRIQNLYSNGISRSSRSSALSQDGYGQPIVPVTAAIAYLRNDIVDSDNINIGDDIIEFIPTLVDGYAFDAKFALVRVGDIVRINYGTIEVPFVIKEKKYILSEKKYIIRIAGKNISYSPNAHARIDRPLFNNNKFGVLSIAAANNKFNELPSLIVTSPRGGEALGIGFSPDQFDEKHYLLYLALYPTGFAQDGYTILPAIDVTGNAGTTPGLYTLDSIVEATNNKFRQSGYNYRFVAFSYKGEFGIMLADSYNNAAFSILSGVVDPNGFFSQTATNFTFTKNVIDLFPSTGTVGRDPLGFGPYGANIASPPYMTSYGSAEAAQNPTKLFIPLSRNNYYVNGVEKSRLPQEIDQVLDAYGDGYWIGHITEKPTYSGRVQVKYRVYLDLSNSNLKKGKTLVAQSLNSGKLVDFGRFTINNIEFVNCSPYIYTDITVFDAVHAKGFSPTATLAVDGYVRLYFNSDSVSFSKETSTDFDSLAPFKRHIETYINESGETFTHERGRFLVGGANSILVNDSVTIYSSSELAKMDIVKISPKLRGYQFGTVNKITLQINNYDSISGIYDGYLASYNGTSLTEQGPTIFGKKGEVTRFYDETNIDYIDIIFDNYTNTFNASFVAQSINTFSNAKLDIQLFPTLSLDEEVSLIGTCQLNDSINYVSRLRDERQFGNIAEKELSTSALNFIALPEKLLHLNGVVRGFDIVNVSNEFISLRGGVALVNGKFQNLNDEIFTIPKVKEYYNFAYFPVNWLLCINSIGELVIVPMADYDNLSATPNDPTRLFTAFNTVLLNIYVTDSTTFANLINNKKDLTVLYIVKSTITGSGTSSVVSLSYQDVRRFVNDQDSSMPAVVTNDAAQGNFKNFTTAINWLRYNNTLQNTLALKGSSTFSSAFDFQSSEFNLFAQGKSAALTFGSTVNVSKFKFTDLTLAMNSTVTASNTIFTNSQLTIGASAAFTNSNFDCIFNNAPLGTLTIGGAITSTNSIFTNSFITAIGTSSFTDSKLIYCPTTQITGAATLQNLIAVGAPVSKSDMNITGAVDIASSAFNDYDFIIGGNTTTSLSTFINEYLGTFSVAGSITSTTSAFTNYTISGTNTSSFFDVKLTNCPVNITGAISFTNSTLANTTFTNSPSNDLINKKVFATGAITSINSTFINNIITATGVSSFTDSKLTYCPITNSGNVTFDSTHLVGTPISHTAIIINGGGSITATSSSFKDCDITVAGGANISNSTFENCTLSIAGNTTISNTRFINCIVTFSGTTSPGSNLYFTDSTVTFTGASTVSSANFINTTATFTGALTATTVKFINCSLTFSAGGTFTDVFIDPSTVTIGGQITLNGINTIIDSTISVTTAKAFILTSNFRFERNAVIYTGVPGTGYDLTNLVNDGYGMMYANVLTNLVDVKIKDNSFTTSMSDRFSFISLQLSDYAAVVENLNISNNKFISAAAVTDDLRAVISITSTLITAAGAGAYPKNPKLVNVLIENNMCNYNQMILVSTKRSTSNIAFVGAMLSTTNVRIANNTCGTIGIITAGIGAYSLSNVGIPNNGLIRDKEDQLVISGNHCKFIANLDYRGDYIPFTSTAFPAPAFGNDYISVPTGALFVSNNTANWIQIGCASSSASNDGAMIINNRLHPADPAYLSNYIDTEVSTSIPGNVGILLRKEAANAGTTYSIISGNIICKKPLVNSVGVGVNYYYDAAIVCFNNANINNNSVIGVVNTATNVASPYSAILYLHSSCNVIVTGNNFDRAGLGIQAYVKGQTGATSQVRITDNIFDSQFIDFSNTIETVGIDIPSAWSYYQNRNQIFYKEISLVDNTYGLRARLAGSLPTIAYPASTVNLIATDNGWGTDPVQLTAYSQNNTPLTLYGVQASDHILVVDDFNNDGGASILYTRSWTKRGPVDTCLPENVKILNAKIGYFEYSWTGVNVLYVTTNAVQYNVATLTMFKYKDTTTSNDAINGVLNVRDQVTQPYNGDDLSVSDRVYASHFVTTAADETNLRTNSVIITVDLTAHDFTTNKNYRLGFSMDQMWLRSSPATGNYLSFRWSPIVLKCIYK